VPLLEGNRHDCHSGLWGELMGRVADICQPTQHDDSESNCGGKSEVKMTRQDIAALCWLQHGSETQSGTSSKGPPSPPRGCTATVNQICLEPARLEAAEEAPRDLASRSTTSGLDDESWDFDNDK
jgi:hypothetical protein